MGNEEFFEWDEQIDAMILPVRQAIARKNKANAQLQIELAKTQAEARQWHQYTNAVIAMVPVALRRFIVSRLDATGRGYVVEGIWNHILDRTVAHKREAESAHIDRAKEKVIEAALVWLKEGRNSRTLAGNRTYTEKHFELYQAVVALDSLTVKNSA